MHISSFLFLVFCICLASSTSAMTASKRRTCYLFNRFLLHHCITSMSPRRLLFDGTKKFNASRLVCRNVFRSRVPEFGFHGVLRIQNRQRFCGEGRKATDAVPQP